MNSYIPSTEYKESTKFNWNVLKFLSAVFNLIPYTLCIYNHLLSNSIFFSSQPFKNIFHNLLTTILFQPFVTCQNEFSQSLLFCSLLYFEPELFLPVAFLMLTVLFILGTMQAFVSLYPFLQLLSNCFHFPCLYLIIFCPLFFSFSTSLTWQFKLIPLNETQENMSSPAI